MLKRFRRRISNTATATAGPVSQSDLDSVLVFVSDLERRQTYTEPGMADWQLWRDGKLVPLFITALLDLGHHVGPDVDVACKAEEPAVDCWEAGMLYPSWEQAVALAKLVDVRVRDLAHPDAKPRHHDNRPLRRRSRMAILSFEPHAVHETTAADPQPPSALL